MSQPKQYSPALEPGRGSNFNGLEVSMREDLAGKWVSLSDYAALAAENERLRKAGDVLMEVYCESNFYELERRDWKTIPSVADWLAAKEGRDAK